MAKHTTILRVHKDFFFFTFSSPNLKGNFFCNHFSSPNVYFHDIDEHQSHKKEVWLIVIIYIYGVTESGFDCWGVQGAALMLFLFCECTWNASTISLDLPAFDDTGSLASPPD